MIELIQYGVEVPQDKSSLICTAVQTVLMHENRSGNVTVLLTTEDEIRSLNAKFRCIDRVTDVLTFPAWEGEDLIAPPDGYLGDIAICVRRAEEQAEEYGHSLERELAFLAVHGGLHLLGYDHMVTEDEMIMRGKQAEILRQMGLEI